MRSPGEGLGLSGLPRIATRGFSAFENLLRHNDPMTNDSGLVLTPTAPLARAENLKGAREFAARGALAWARPEILSFSAWVNRLRDDYYLLAEDGWVPIGWNHSPPMQRVKGSLTDGILGLEWIHKCVSKWHCYDKVSRAKNSH